MEAWVIGILVIVQLLGVVIVETARILGRGILEFYNLRIDWGLIRTLFPGFGSGTVFQTDIDSGSGMGHGKKINTVYDLASNYY